MNPPPTDNRPFVLKIPARDPRFRKSLDILGSVLGRVLSLEGLNEIYAGALRESESLSFPARTLKAMNLTYDLTEADRARIPKEGPLVVVSNHPFGGIEGVILAGLLSSVRPDVKLMANYLLKRIPEMCPYLIFVDPFGTEASVRANLAGIKQSIQWVKDGGALGVFPSGEVSHLNLKKRRIADPQWSETIARIVRRTEAKVLPIYFAGANSLLFQLCGLIHPRLRTAMLPRELINKAHKTLVLRVGQPIPFSALSGFERDADLMDFLRLRTYMLANRKPERERRGPRLPIRPRRARLAPIADPADPAALRAEIDRLSEKETLLTASSFKVLVTTADESPSVMHEIGRLREITFREANEGTGQAIDLDRFDRYYLHLFVWDTEAAQMVGAYRMGPTDWILEHRGIRGFYTRTLFRYRRKLINQLNPGLELGRSFIQPSYQKNYSALLLLWKGIAAYIARHPQYRHLFGPVSINNEYLSVSRQLLVRFLRANNFEHDLARLIKPRKPLRLKPIRNVDRHTLSRVLTGVDQVSDLIEDIERDNKGIPILLKQYLKLGGKLLAFNVDPCFSFVLDGLIWVDLLRTDRRVLSRYMGAEGMKALLKHHGQDA